MHDLMKKKKTPQKRNARSKKEERRKTWREHLFDIVLGLAVAAMFIVLSWLGRRTISNIPVSALWGCVLATLFFVLVWAAFRKNLDKGTFLIYLFVGFLGGIFLFIFLGTVFLGTNYLFPRSDPYQRKAVVYGKKETHRSRGFTSYYIKLGFYDGRRYAWDGGYKEYDRFQQGDTCDVTLYKGITILLTTKGEPNTTIAQCLECHSSTLQEREVSHSGLYKVFGANGLLGYTDMPQMNGDSILIIKDGSGVGTVSYAQGDFSIIGTLNYLTALSNYDVRYLYFVLSVFNFQSYKTGMAIPHIYFKDYGNAKIYCPPLSEQKRIANVLGKLESKLFLEQNILVSFNLQKQYLLHQMFI